MLHGGVLFAMDCGTLGKMISLSEPITFTINGENGECLLDSCSKGQLIFSTVINVN